VENLCLIFAGKIMKDTETLASHNVKDGMTVHLVIKQSAAAAAGGGSSGAATSPPPAAAPAAAPVPPAPADIGASPFGIGGFGGIPGLGNLGMGSANFMEMQQRMQRDLLANPDMMRQVSLSNTNQSMQDLVLPLPYSVVSKVLLCQGH
jgi:ubiquilin